MITFKSLIAWMLSLSFALWVPDRAFANRFMEEAEYNIQIERQAAIAKAHEIIEEDLKNAQRVIVQSTQQVSRSLNAFETYRSQIERLERSFSELNEQANAYEPAVENLRLATTEYERLVRERYLYSWQPTMAQIQTLKLTPLLRETILAFDQTCTSGRSLANYVGPNATIPRPPELQFSIDAFFGFVYGQEDAANNSPNYGFDVQQYNYRHPNRRVYETQQGASVVGGIASSIALSAEAVGASNFLIKAASWVGPIGLGVAAAIGLGLHIYSSNKAADALSQWHQARFHQLRNRSLGDKIAAHYREACRGSVALLNPVLVALEDIEVGGARYETRLRQHEASRTEVAAFMSVLSEVSEASCKLNLKEMFESGVCVASHQGAWDSNRPTKCQILDGRRKVVAQHQRCELPLTAGHRVNDLSAEQQLVDRYTADSSRNHKMVQYLQHQIVETLGINKAETFTMLNSLSNSQLHAQQMRTFRTLHRLAQLTRELRGTDQESQSRRFSDLRDRQAFFEFKARLTNLVANAIRMSFGRQELLRVAPEVANLSSDFAPFYQRFRHIGEVQNLHRGLEHVAGLVGYAR